MSSPNTKFSDSQPLAARLRPQVIEDFVGQTHLMGKGQPLRRCIEEGRPHSMLLWGPPGTGKTTLAKLIATMCHAEFIAISAVLAGVKDIRDAIAHAQQLREQFNQDTLLFVDEIHRFNKAQQDALLPYVEDGTVCFIGATTENPSFEVNKALLSRCRLYVLKSLTPHELKQILYRAVDKFSIDEVVIERIIRSADGDARRLLNIVDIVMETKDFSLATVEQVIQQDYRKYDKQGEDFYNQISALHKAVRGSSPDGALYWLGRMLDGGCRGEYIARRVIRMASEDIGNADPRGLTIALDAWQAFERLGHPEGDLALAQAVVYLACAPKSNATYVAFKKVMADIKTAPSYAVPLHLRNAPTNMMKDLGYGKAYRYDPDEPNGFAKGQSYLPEEMGERQYYFPTNQGLEIKIAEKLKNLRDDNTGCRKKKLYNQAETILNDL